MFKSRIQSIIEAVVVVVLQTIYLAACQRPCVFRTPKYSPSFAGALYSPRPINNEANHDPSCRFVRHRNGRMIAGQSSRRKKKRAKIFSALQSASIRPSIGPSVGLSVLPYAILNASLKASRLNDVQSALALPSKTSPIAECVLFQVYEVCVCIFPIYIYIIFLL